MTTFGTPLSPVPGVELEGYLDEISLTPGQTLDVMLSGEGSAELSVVRLIHGDPNPDGPGVREEPQHWRAPARVELTRQRLPLGSYLEIPDRGNLTPQGSFTLALWVKPTLVTDRWQALAAKWAPPAISFGLFCVGHRSLLAAISQDGIRAEWITALEFVTHNTWQFVAFTFCEDSGDACLYQLAPSSSPELAASGLAAASGLVVSRKRLSKGPVYQTQAPLLFGAIALPDGSGHWAHLNGKLAGPALLDHAADERELARLAEGGVQVAASVARGAWDLTQNVTGTAVVDVSPHGNHGIAINAPTRAVTGPRFSGLFATRYSDRPEQYDAIHLHADDLADAAWVSSAQLQAPETARSGVYALRARTDRDSLTLPFVLRPKEPAAKVAVVLPTLTWQAYSSNRAPYSQTEDGMVDRTLCLYDVHADGSMVRYCTRRKPTRSGDPSTGIRQWGAHTVPANLYLIDWLEHSGFEYDTHTDQDIHAEGAELLESYACVVLGSHHEYWTGAMLDALEAYIAGGGRVAYLGGNGLFWVTSIHPDRPYLIEVRKSGDGDYEDYFARPEPGELEHATTLEAGGMWARRGRPPRRFVGVEHAANVFVQASGRWGFTRLPTSWEPRYRFAFDGIDDDVIGGFGLNLGTAAAYEMDAQQEWQFPAEWQIALLARAEHETFLSLMRNPVRPRADITLLTAPGGGAVFSAGAVTWTGSLSHNHYDNNVARMTENVLRRFLDTPHGESVLSLDADEVSP